ncbi:ATP-binding cassette domain-containing protein [Agrobacterium sp. SHOUNA12C]|uniref:Cell division ATP-binding protein FtsE n=1 Tax=Rhizobium rhizogenes NBRC 13257 TaxID=1220581 RepID=A0AA87U7P7_RHIRH|nr:ATP-binding cassette domain-containing protein [Rhizobium rhizogenes]MCJ9723024.1 ATP-binding cassette domain-containing protein [Agrobacterium sp. BETTINA12B]MCJ9758400.1 ATP-binding cassette domain-containing protein [Agrobacterium sp. SHOUNA12C]NTF58231.1 ATP-binding cassette domain-containing protein [Rhizobium rhizogenes]NTF77813.1 ATP-binding cassette domain-containing protein [Rhizobium rhizogenes]NTF96735.1 ATP-binding cassette domain-containing protein [Rhizobium rhizogenes]
MAAVIDSDIAPATVWPVPCAERSQTVLEEQGAEPGQRPGSVVFEGIGKTYTSSAGSVQALQDISLDIPAGAIYGIIGRSGAGKSSLLRTINRLEKPTSGRVLVDGEDIGGYDEDALVALRRRVGMIFQHFNLLSAKTVWGNVALPLIVAGVPRRQIEERVAEVLALVGLEDKRDTYPSRLSGGQKQRVGIARALVHHPEILLCDEATSALDPETTLSILQLLKDINRRLNLTIVLITHEMSVIREICDHVVVLEQGSMVESGPVWRVFGNPQHAATRALLQPLHRDIPEDVARRLRLEADPARREDAIIALSYTGEGGLEPDIAAIAAAIGAPVRLLQSSLDRIDGHVHGRLLIATRRPENRRLPGLAGLAHETRILGYVDVDV